MSTYRRAKIEGRVFFFTLTLADRSSDLLVRDIDRLRSAYREAKAKQPFETEAICILPDHLHALWSLPEEGSDFASRWMQIKAGFSRGLPASAARSASKVAKREKGIWQRRYWEHTIRDDADGAPYERSTNQEFSDHCRCSCHGLGITPK
jgi:putative transposase